MRKWLKIIGFSLGGFLLLLVLLSICVSVFFQPQLRALFERELNKQLTGRIELGDGSISLFRHFPNASMTFSEVTVYSDRSEAPDTLLRAGRVSFYFNPFSLISGNYAIQQMSLEDASLVLLVDAEGKPNYEIWATTEPEDDAPSEGFDLSIQKARLKNVALQYLNRKDKQDFQVLFADLELGGNFSDTDFKLKTKGDLELKRIWAGEVDYAADLPLTLDWAVQVSTGPGFFKMDRGHLTIARDDYELLGEAKQTGAGWETDLHVDGKDVSVRSLIALLPGVYREQWKGLDSEGSLNFTATANGLAAPGRMPHIEINFDLADGTVSHPDMKGRLKDVALKGHFTNGKANTLATSTLRIDPFSAKMEKGNLNSRLTLNDLSDPRIDLFVDALVDLDQVGALLEMGEVEDLKGSIEVRNLVLNGRISDMLSSRNWHRMESGGKITFHDVRGDYRNKPVALTEGFIELDRNQFLLHDLQLKAASSDLRVNGKSSNVLSYLAGRMTGEKDPVLNIEATLQSKNLDVEELAALFETEDAGPQAIEGAGHPASSEASLVAFLKELRGDLEVDIDQLSVYTFNASDVGFALNISPYLTKMKQVRARTSEGNLRGEAMMRFLNNQPSVEGNLYLEGLNIKTLFSEFGNFWQDFIVDENLAGRGNASIRFFLRWDEHLNFLTDKMDVRGDLEISEGELVDFKPLEQLSSYVKVKELEHIQFSTLKNTVIIRNGQVMLPAMAIKSTALNLWISGTHTFENEIDYQVQIDMMDVLARKIKLGKMKLDRAEQKGDGMFNVYVTMTGDVNDPTFETDKAAVLTAFQESRKELDPQFIDFEGLESEGTDEQAPKPKKREYSDTDLEFIDW